MIGYHTHFDRRGTLNECDMVGAGLWVGAASFAHLAPAGSRVMDLREGYFRDSIEEPVDADLVERLADEAKAVIDARGTVYIGCTSGLNRSPLVAALVLMKQGRTADDAIAHLRARRGADVLCNPTFEAWLRSREAAA